MEEAANGVNHVLVGSGAGALLMLLAYAFLVPRWERSTRKLSVHVSVGSLVGAVVGGLVVHASLRPSVDWVVVFALGASFGVGELLTRYRDAPARALLTGSGGVYIIVNGFASVLALALARTFGWLTSAPGVPPLDSEFWTQLLASGFGAMAILRSALFIVKSGGDDVPVGPSAFMQSLLDAADRGVDRRRAQERAIAAAKLLQRLDPAKTIAVLPEAFFALMQNLSPDNREEIRTRVQSITQLKVPPRVRLLCFGALAMTYVGEDVLRAAIGALEPDIVSAEDETIAAAVAIASAESARSSASSAARTEITARDLDEAARNIEAMVDAAIAKPAQDCKSPRSADGKNLRPVPANA
jgi:hypothetical protein